MTSTYTDPSTQERARIETFEHLAAAVDDFEAYDAPHAARIAQLCGQLAKLFLLAPHDRASLRVAALAHDLGEAAMRRDYIKRAGTLSEAERQDLARHPVIGEQEAARAGANRAAQLLVRWHHEWWNGAGYPDALHADQIPLMARILRVADAYASLTKARPFRPARTTEEARRHLTEWAGIEFDPQVVRAFLSLNISDGHRSNTSTPEETPAMSSPLSPASSLFAAHNGEATADSFSPALHSDSGAAADRWLAFDVSVLRRIKFRSIALPFGNEAHLCAALKRAGVRVTVNAATQSAAIRNGASLVYDDVKLTEGDVETVLEDAYVPGYTLRNQSLGKYFREVDAWWFDNVRANINKLATEAARTHALALGVLVGDYARSFDATTRSLRQPLSKVFHRLWSAQIPAANNSQSCHSERREARDFIAEQRAAELLFLRLPRARNGWLGQQNVTDDWREKWVRDEDESASESQNRSAIKSGALIESKQQYLRYVEELLGTALHIETWAIAHAEDGFVSTAELVEIISRLRKVETIYTKDFSELMGVRASIITA